MEDLEFYWRDRREPEAAAPDAITVTSLPNLFAWASEGKLCDGTERAYVTVVGSGRDEVYARVEHQERLFDPPGAIRDVRGPGIFYWATEGIPSHLAARLRSLTLPADCREPWRFLTPMPEPPQAWDLLWGLVLVRDFFLSSGWQERADVPGTPHATFLALLREARFFAVEGKDVAPAVRSLAGWLERSPVERTLDRLSLDAERPPPLPEDESVDLLLAVLSLAQANGLLGRLVLTLDQVEGVRTAERAKEVVALLNTISSPGFSTSLGILLGWRGSDFDAERVRRASPTLYERLVRSEVRV